MRGTGSERMLPQKVPNDQCTAMPIKIESRAARDGLREQAAAQDIIGEEVQEDAQRAHAQHIRGRVVPTGEEARQGGQQVGDARILREKKAPRGPARKQRGIPRPQDLRIVLQVAVHADAPGVEIQRPCRAHQQNSPASRTRTRSVDRYVSDAVSFMAAAHPLLKVYPVSPGGCRSAAWCRAAFGAGEAGGCRHDLPRGLPVAHLSAK